uniref:Putative omega-6 fatty acid desaturase endoplasmic reticulum isozyme 1 n=1 Tax=Ixodes ricinus TaxID=34613 RepID=A0A0K8RFD8_IXORI
MEKLHLTNNTWTVTWPVVVLGEFIFVPEDPAFLGRICLYLHTFPKLPPYSLVNGRTVITIIVDQELV